MTLEKDSSYSPPRPPHFARLNAIRDRLSDLRREVTMMRLEEKLWEGWLTPVEGGMTCVIIAAYAAIEEMEKHHKKWASEITSPK